MTKLTFECPECGETRARLFRAMVPTTYQVDEDGQLILVDDEPPHIMDIADDFDMLCLACETVSDVSEFMRD